MANGNGPTKAELSDILSDIADLAEDALDPGLTREEVIDKVKTLADLASGEGESEDEEEDADQD